MSPVQETIRAKYYYEIILNGKHFYVSTSMFNASLSYRSHRIWSELHNKVSLVKDRTLDNLSKVTLDPIEFFAIKLKCTDLQRGKWPQEFNRIKQLPIQDFHNYGYFS